MPVDRASGMMPEALYAPLRDDDRSSPGADVDGRAIGTARIASGLDQRGSVASGFGRRYSTVVSTGSKPSDW
jgi:hypothetical protein